MQLLERPLMTRHQIFTWFTIHLQTILRADGGNSAAGLGWSYIVLMWIDPGPP